MAATTTIVWFRQDLRLCDNPALNAACREDSIIPIYILDDVNPKEHKLGAASRWWLHHSLDSLNKSLDNKLALFNDCPIKLLVKLAKDNNIKKVVWNRCYEPWSIARDKKIKEQLQKHQIEVESFNASLLWEPWEVLKSDDNPYKVFSPFYKKRCLTTIEPRKPFNKPRKINAIQIESKEQKTLEQLDLIPKINWYANIEKEWKAGESSAKKTLKKFLEQKIDRYKLGRDFPSENSVSRLSPHLHFGEISPNLVWHSTKELEFDNNVEHFCSELGWREFSYSLLYNFPTLPKKNLQSKFDNFPWKKNTKMLKAWQKGLTGYPIVDAGMRELWQTGYMHNRVRMIVGSFLVKNLLIHWHEGEKWFWDCLVDADLANNSASWQWIAGSGADAAPYFRIFNPITQGERFDPKGIYTKKYMPELKDLPDKYLFKPWEAPELILKDANIILGKTYPKPIVDVKQSRLDALEAFAKIKANEINK